MRNLEFPNNVYKKKICSIEESKEIPIHDRYFFKKQKKKDIIPGLEWGPSECEAVNKSL